MEASALPFRIQFLKLSASASIRRIQEFRVAARKQSKDGSPLHTAHKLPRRAIFLPLIGVNLIFTNVCTAFAAPVKEMKEPEILRILKLASGVRIQDVVEGQGPEASEGDLVEFNYVCRRSNGYFVHSSVDQFSGESSPVILPLNDKQIIKGLKEVLIGMKVGGKRRALIPPSVGYVSETLQPIPEEVNISSADSYSMLVHLGCSLVLAGAFCLMQRSL